MARILAIDYGTKRTGLAVTDPLQITPGALDTVPTHQLLNYLAEYLEREEVETIVLGKPTQMDATPSATWQAIQALAKKLQHLYPQIRLEYVDERTMTFTTKISTVLENPYICREISTTPDNAHADKEIQLLG